MRTRIRRTEWRKGLVAAACVAAAVAGILLLGKAPPVLATNGYSPNQQLALPIIAPIGPTGVAFVVSGAEPSLRVAQDGTIYVASIRAVPLGVDLFRYYAPVDGPPNADGTLPFKYEGQPDGCGLFETACQEFGLAQGGGDVDIAVNNPGGGAIPNLALTSLTVAPGVTGTHSTDRGDTFAQPNPAVTLIPGNDREWNEATADFTVYMSYHDLATDNIEVQRSFDGGETYVSGFGEAIDPQTLLTAAQNNVQGRLVIDKGQCAASAGNLYVVFSSTDNALENAEGGSLRDVYVGVSTDVNLGLPVFTFTDHKAAVTPPGTHTNQVFPVLAADNFGNLYAAWSDNTNISYASSRDHGNTWTVPVRVNQGATIGNANVMPWIAADAFGHVVIVWYGDNQPGSSNDPTALAPCPAGSTTCMQQWAQWNVYAAETVDGFDPSPIFIQRQVSDHVIHRGTLSTGGTFGSANRNLLDYFNVAFDSQHRANIGFADDHLVNPDCASIGSGACGPDDPNTARLIRPYFTYQLQPSAGVQSSGVCGPQPPPPPGESVTGSGSINGQSGGKAKFGLIARSNPLNGALSYHDDSQSLDVKSSGGITSLAFNGNCATFGGNAKVNGNVGYSYQVNACDNDSSGGSDTLFISVTGPNFSYSNGGALTNGDIRLHQQ